MYAPMDLFDWLSIVGKLRSDKLTQAQVGERIGWSREQVSQYTMLLDKVATPILNQAASQQKGRVASDATGVAFDFTEGWFRTSGLYDLEDEYRLNKRDDFVEY